MTSSVADAAALAPHAPGVYFFLGRERELLYVGKAADLRRRLGDHAREQGRTDDVRRHVLLDGVAGVHWEECSDEEAALRREADLIVMLRPAFNASHAEQDPDVYLVVTHGPTRTTFEVTPEPTGPGRVYGTFPHLAKGAFSHTAKQTKGGYTALLRLLWASSAPDAAARIPARISGSSPPNRIEMPSEPDRRALLHDYLSGRSARLLPALQAAIAAAGLPAFTRAALDRDGEPAQEFFVLGPRNVREFRLRHALAPGPVPASVMAALLAAEVRETIGDFRPGAPRTATVALGRHATRGRELREQLRH